MHKITDYIICLDEQWQIGGEFESVIFQFCLVPLVIQKIAYSNSSVFQDFIIH